MTFWELLTIAAGVYIFDERVGYKAADQTFSYILHYLKSTGKYQAGCPVFMFFSIMPGPPIKSILDVSVLRSGTTSSTSVPSGVIYDTWAHAVCT